MLLQALPHVSQPPGFATWRSRLPAQLPLRALHVIPALEFVERISIVLAHKLDNSLKQTEIYMPLGKPLHITRKRREGNPAQACPYT